MANLSEDIQCAGSDTRPPMLDKTDFASWQQRIRLYCRGKENGVNILKSERPQSIRICQHDEEGIFMQTLPCAQTFTSRFTKRIYIIRLSNHYPDAKGHMGQCEDARVDGSELTIGKTVYHKLYDDLNTFVRTRRRTIHDTITKAHVQYENKIDVGTSHITDKADPLALLSLFRQLYHLQSSNIFTTEPTFIIPHSVNTSLHTNLPSSINNKLSFINPRNQATVLDGRVVVQNVQGRQNRGQGNNARGAGAAGYGGAQNRVGNANPGQARQVQDLDHFLGLLFVNIIMDTDAGRCTTKVKDHAVPVVQNDDLRFQMICLIMMRHVQPAMYSGHVLSHPVMHGV
ncbi:hypothetical protein Tco_0535369 [Tanacetum coccineum]